MTRIKKLLVAGLMAVITLCVSLGSAIVNVSQSIFSWITASAKTYDYSNSLDDGETNTVQGAVLTVEGLASTCVMGESINIPKAITSSITPTETVVQIKNPYGKDMLYMENVTDEVDPSIILHAVGTSKNTEIIDDSGANYVFSPNQVGTYTVQYAVKANNVWTLTPIFEINVTKESYSMELEKNSEIVMPSKYDINSNRDVTIDLPLVYDKDGNQIKEFVLSQDDGHGNYYVAEYVTLGGEGKGVYFDNDNIPHEDDLSNITTTKNIYETYSTYKIKKVNDISTIEYGLQIEISIPGESSKSNVTTNSDNLISLNYTVDADNYYIASAYKFRPEAGKNIVTYRLCKSNFGNTQNPYSYFDFQINGSSAYAYGDIDLGVSTDSQLVYSDVDLNEKCYLPEVNAIDKNNNSNALDAHYFYEVTYVGTSSEPVTEKAFESVSMGKDENGYYFVAKKAGIYNVYYNAVDFYGNTDDNADKYDYDIKNVSDRVSPTLYAVNSYDFNDLTTLNKDIDYSYKTNTVVYVDATATESSEMPLVAIPAIYATDNVADFNNLKISREISSSNFKNKDGEKVSSFTIDIQTNNNSQTDYDVIDNIKNIGIYDNDTNTLNKFENIVTFKDYTGSSYKVVNNEFLTNSDDVITEDNALRKAKSSQVAYVKIDPRLFGEGKYTVTLKAQESDNSSSNYSKYSTYTFEVVYATDSKDTKAPEVKFDDITTIGNLTSLDKVSVSKPTITDDVDQNIYAKYYVMVEGTNTTFYPIEIKDDKLEFTVSDAMYNEASVVGELNIVAFAFDDFADETFNPATSYSAFKANPTADNYKHIGFGSVAFSVKNTSDSVAPIITNNDYAKTGVTYNETDFDQFSEATVKGIQWTGNTSTDVLTIKVLDSNGNEVDHEEVGFSVVKNTSATDTTNFSDKYIYTLDGIKFVASEADNYTINITISDDGNNSTSFAKVLLQANDKEAPIIEGILGTTATIELGETYYFKNIKATDKKTANVSFTVECVGKDNVGNKSSWFNNEKMEFTPKAVGTYTISVTASDNDGNNSTKSFDVKVVDTQKPTLTLTNAKTSTMLFNESTITTNNSTTVFQEVTLSGFVVTDENQNNKGFNGVLGATGSLKITTPDNDSYTISMSGVIEGENPLNIKQNDEGNFTFTPEERGKYTATYSGVDLNGNKSNTETILIYVGDTEDPTVKLTDSFAEKLASGFKVGDTLTVESAVVFDDEDNMLQSKTNGQVVLKDNYGFKNNASSTQDPCSKITVQVTDDDDNTVKYETTTNTVTNLDAYNFTFETAGTYTITITAKDQVGNSGMITKTFVVSSTTSSSEESSSSNVLGTVLIIVSIAILAIVVIYFVTGTKFLPKKRKSKKVKQENENKNSNV